MLKLLLELTFCAYCRHINTSTGTGISVCLESKKLRAELKRKYYAHINYLNENIEKCRFKITCNFVRHTCNLKCSAWRNTIVGIAENSLSETSFSYIIPWIRYLADEKCCVLCEISDTEILSLFCVRNKIEVSRCDVRIHGPVWRWRTFGNDIYMQ